MNPTSTSNLFDQLPRGYHMDRRLGPVYEQAPAGADDLTLIRGVGTREAVILNRLGVYFFAQIALWEHRETCVFADEVGRPASGLSQEQWVEQAQVLCRPQRAEPLNLAGYRPAPLLKTMALICCGLFVGCLLVYWMSLQSNAPLRGVLSADITSLRVPAESRLLSVDVTPGKEVFSGDQLLTLEKTEHLAMIQLQERRVLDLERQLQQAEAQAALDLAWRTRELDRELSDVRTRAHLIQEVKRSSDDEVYRTTSSSGRIRRIGALGVVDARMASGSRYYSAQKKPARANTMIFISGASGESSVDVRPPVPLTLPVQAKAQPVRLASEPAADGILSVEARSVELRLERLEELREVLPQQVRRAAGVESMRVQFDEAIQRLKEMKTLSRDVAVLCPAYGKVGQIRYKAGDTMSTGEIMLKILHVDRRYVIINVPTHRVNEIEPGTIVDLIFPGNDRYRGKVSNLPMLAETSRPEDTSLVTVRVEPTGRLWPEIPVGSHIDVVVDDASVF